MKFYSVWQPLKNEDAHTALVFGFLRHAPPELALQPWLQKVLGPGVKTDSLSVGHFWPRYPSSEQEITEPDLAFPVDGEDSWVIIEAKPSYQQHVAAQLAREVIDTVAATGASHVTLVMIAADLGEPPELEAWEQHIKAKLAESGLGAKMRLAYSSWADLGAWIEACGEVSSEWAAYAADVLQQLRSKALLGYKGVDVFQGLSEISVVTVIEGYNRVVLAARQFFLALHGSSGFQALGLQPPAHKGFEMLRDDTSSVITQDPDWFTTTTMISPYRHPAWAYGTGAFAGFFFDDDDAYIVAGAFAGTGLANFALSFGYSEEVALDALTNEILKSTGAPQLDTASTGGGIEFRYGARIWSDSQAAEDIEWTLTALNDAVGLLGT
jgi:hypothetical protein